MFYFACNDVLSEEI